MQPLNGNLTKMLLHAKINKLIVLDDSVIVGVVPEHVFDEVVNFCFLFKQDSDQKVANLSLLELHVLIGVKLNNLFIEYFSDSEGQLVGLEVKLILPGRLPLQPYVSLLLLFPRSHPLFESNLITVSNQQIACCYLICAIIAYNSLIMKKKDNLLEILKRENDYHLTSFLSPNDLLSLALLNKKYYTFLAGILESQRLDSHQTVKQTKAKSQKSKTTKQKQQVQQQTQVDIIKIPLHKFAKKAENAKWKKIDKLDIFNSYLNKKIQNRTAIFYRNEDTNEVIFINRSIVDPTLNYNKGGFGDSFITNTLYQDIFAEGKVNEHDFSSMEGLLRRQKQMLEKLQLKKEEERKNNQISYEEQLSKAMKMSKFAIILCFGGSFSFGIFQNGKCVLHRSDRKYVCRQKAGERQFNKDKQSGTQIQSIGSQIRRDQQKKHVINVGQILKEHNNELKQCEIIFLQAPGLNRLFVINENQNLDGMQQHLRSVCVTAKKANFTQVQALFETISQVHCVQYLTGLQGGKVKRTKK